MQSTPLLLDKLRADFPAFSFRSGEEFHWSFPNKTIFYEENGDAALLLHEVAHGVLEHADYTRDIALVEMERDAWEYARKMLFPRYDIPFQEDFVEDTLDTYRDWLHARSTCPHCQSTGVQIKPALYKCLACHTKWEVNDARICALRRYVVTPKTPL